MKTLRKASFRRPTLGLIVLLVALAAGAGLLLPAKSAAIPFCGYSVVWTYYADPAMTVYSGTCYSACDGYYGCWGTLTSYYTRAMYECESC